MKYQLKPMQGLAVLLALGAGAAQADPEMLLTSTRYDVEYPVVAYSAPARENRVYRLQQKLNSGEVKLQWEPKTGYLRSLLAALDIDPDSQVLVFSRTSLQIERISPAKPRAVYFNDDTYIGFVQDSPLIELTAIDADKGAVFYGFDNRQEYPPGFEREGSRCLTCHDTFSMTGGGVPRVMVLSSPVDDPSDTRGIASAQDVDDRTPIGDRWGGWYVTGSTGSRAHFGNLPVRGDRGGEKLRQLREQRHNIPRLEDYIDTSNYLTGQSDVVALTVLEHQTWLQNLITRVDYKIRTVMAREGEDSVAGGSTGLIRSWSDVSPNDQVRLEQMIEPLVKALFMHDAVDFEDAMRGSNGFAQRFAKLGPHDSKGRSLRELDLQTRLFRYPLSFLIYSEQFDSLPQYALDYVHKRIVEVLRGTDTRGIAAKLTEAQRRAITEILIDTKPSLAALLRAGHSTG